DNDLLVINDAITPGVGAISWVSGRVLDRSGSPLRGALVEIWQADNDGSYIHSNGVNGGRRDSNFQGYGRFLTGSTGEYLFRTIKPGLYPGRSRHADMKITLPSGFSLTTQLYVEGETGNDSVLSGVPQAQRASVVRPWTAIPGSAVGALATTFDIVMGYTLVDNPTATRPSLVSMAGVSNAATLHAGAAGGSWVTIFGAGLSSATRTWRTSDVIGGQLPSTLDDVSVRINNQPASVYYISPRQLNVLAPEPVADGNVQVTVTNASGTSDPVTVNLRRFMPGFFQFPGEHAAAVRADGTLIGPAGLIDGATTVPARPGDVVLLFGTGFGPTSPAIAASEVVSTPLPTANTVKIRIDTKDIPVAFAGLTSAGLYQFNITVPDLPDGDYPVVAEVASIRTAKFVKLRIERATTAAVPAHSPARLGGDQKPYLALIDRIRKTLV
ncbi:MAG: IPT/TIG domain-containing protein, partial [Bryobacteraceae bacterium]